VDTTGITRVETTSGQERIDECRRIVDRKSVRIIDGTIVDLWSASTIIGVFDRLEKPENKAKFLTMGIVSMAHVAYKVIERAKAKQ